MNEIRLYKESERKANQFNVYTLLVIALLAIITLVLNEIGIFSLEKNEVRISMIVVVFVSILPEVIILIQNKLLKREKNILEESRFKWLIIICCYITITSLCIALSFHVTLGLVIPTLMVAQYKNNKVLTITSFVASMVLIIVSVYGTLLFGIYDANLMKPLTKEEAKDFLNRVELFKTNRMGSIIFHYVIPRMLCIAAIDYIGISISKRNNEMINTEIALSNKVAEGIIAKSNMQNAVIEHLADIIESRDIETGEHIKRTKQYVSILVNKMKNEEKYRKELDPLMCEYIINSAPLHDIGKIAVSDLILCKPGKLTEEEFNKMKTHTTKGGEIIENILHDLGNEDFLRVAFDIATSHHEKWNGDGYPYGKKGEEIPLPGRIMAIADVFDALVSKRIYKSPMPMDEAIQVIIHDAGTHFDPDIVEVFKEVKEEFIESAKMDI